MNVGDIVVYVVSGFSFYGFLIDHIDEFGQLEDIEGCKHIAKRCRLATADECLLMGFNKESK